MDRTNIQLQAQEQIDREDYVFHFAWVTVANMTKNISYRDLIPSKEDNINVLQNMPKTKV